MKLQKLCAFALMAVLALGLVLPGAAEVNKSSNPMVEAQTLVKARGGDDVINVLLLGNEYGTTGQSAPSANGTKQSKGIGILAYHTDVLMVLSVNQTKGQINLISIPRDTLTYVPGVYGMYKINAAFNCATTVAEGIRHAKEAVSWLLGGVKIDNYVLVDMEAVVTLGNLMGGVDFDMDYNFTGTSGILYRKGYQHLDGMGILDYVRARKNIDSSDLNRTSRGRKMISAITQKLWGDWDMVDKLWSAANKSSVNFYTDLDSGSLLSLYQAVQGIKNREVGSLVLDGQYNYATTCGDFQFRITDQDLRRQVIKTAFGIDADPLEYASLNYIRWMFKGSGVVQEGENVGKNRYYYDGFDFAKYLHRGQMILNTAYRNYNMTSAQQNAVDAFEPIYNEFLAAFEQAAMQADQGDSKATVSESLRKQYEEALQQLSDAFNIGKIYYSHGYHWEQDSYINEYHEIDWR